MSLVGGVVCQESRLSTSLPRYQVVPKAKQREAFQWLLRQAKDFQGKADRNFERKGFIDVSYYDQLLEFLVKDIYDLRSRIIIASQVDSKTYSLGEYFDDLYQATFASTIAGKSPQPHGASDADRLHRQVYRWYGQSPQRYPWYALQLRRCTRLCRWQLISLSLYDGLQRNALKSGASTMVVAIPRQASILWPTSLPSTRQSSTCTLPC